MVDAAESFQEAETGRDDRLKASGGPDDNRVICDVEMTATAVLGTTTMQVSQLLKVGRGAVIELDTRVGDQIDIRVNDLLIARGEVKVIEDRIAVEVTEIIRRAH